MGRSLAEGAGAAGRLEARARGAEGREREEEAAFLEEGARSQGRPAKLQEFGGQRAFWRGSGSCQRNSIESGSAIFGGKAQGRPAKLQLCGGQR